MRKKLCLMILASLCVCAYTACGSSSVTSNEDTNRDYSNNIVIEKEEESETAQMNIGDFSEESIYATNKSNGNLANGGCVLGYKDYIYYSLGDGIYKTKDDGSETALIHKFDENLYGRSCINIVDGWIYFMDISESGNSIALYKMELDGQNLTWICDSVASGGFWVCGDYLYFSGTDVLKIGDTEIVEIYNKESASGYSVNIVDGEIYLYDTRTDSNCVESNGIYKMSMKGENVTKLLDCRADYMLVDDGWIYFQNQNQKDELYRMKTDGTELQAMVGEQLGNINSTGEWIICDIAINGVEGIYRMKKDGTDYTLLVEDGGTRVSEIYVVNDWIYYSFITDAYEVLRRMRLDGSDNQIFSQVLE